MKTKITMMSLHALGILRIPQMQQNHTSQVFCSGMVLGHNVHSHKPDPERQVTYIYCLNPTSFHFSCR